MSQEWFYTVTGEQKGPVSSAELKQLADAGTLKESDLIWKEGMPEWVAAKTIKGLFGAAPSKASSPGIPKPAPVTPPPEKPTASEGKKPGRTASDAFAREDEEEDRPTPKKRPIDDEDDYRPRGGRRSRDDDEDAYERPRGGRRDRDDDDEDFDASPKSKKLKASNDGKKKLNIVGLIGLIISVLGAAISFIPCLGWCFGIPTLCIGLILDVIGLGMALATKKYEPITAIIGLVLCLIGGGANAGYYFYFEKKGKEIKKENDEFMKKLDEDLKKNQNTNQNQNKVVFKNPITANELAREVDRDVLEVFRVYANKRIEVRGKIKKVDTVLELSIELETGNSVYTVINCTMANLKLKKLNLVPGQEVTILGTYVSAGAGQIFMNNCSLKN